MDAITQAQHNGVVLGLKGISEHPVPRLEIDDLLFNKPNVFNLFILALSELQDEKNASEKMAWQQIAGIHGLPTTPWHGVETARKAAGNGYCAHARPTFPTWHRPYLAMMEQTVYAQMAKIADRFPAEAKPKYQEALKEFRFPYWDYYRPRAKTSVLMPGITRPNGTTEFDYDFSLPQIFVVDHVMVRHYDKNDDLVEFPNPLCKYSFPKTGGMTPKDWARAAGFSQTQTVRYPETKNGVIGSVTQQSAVLNRERESNVGHILQMIEDYKSYGTFSSSSLTPGASGNLEGIHGNYHGIIGGGSDGTNQGHMSIVPLAAFDPVFWMHHCLIDRWFAIWQAAHPNKWYDGEFTDKRNPQKRTEIPPLAKEPARPFRHPDGGFWNGDLSRYTETFGYVYTDAVKKSPEDVVKDFKSLYSWVKRKNPQGDKIVPPAALTPLPVAEAQVFNYSATHAVTKSASMIVNQAPQMVLSTMTAAVAGVTEAAGFAAPIVETTDSAPAIDTSPVAPGTNVSLIAFTNMEASAARDGPADYDESEYYREWFVDNIVKRLALNGSFAIFYFIGNFKGDDVEKYAYEPTMAGLNYVFTSSREACDNCGMQDDENIEITGTKMITPMLMDYIKIGELQDLTPANVVPFLVRNLKWRIVDHNGNRHDPRHVPGFHLGVSSSLKPKSGGGAPIYEEYPQVIEHIIANSS